MALLLTKTFQIHSYEADCQGKVKPIAIINYMLEAAGEHADRLGVGITELLSKKMTWVLSRFHLKILTYPVWGQPVTVHTWPSGQDGLFALRDFEITDEKNNVFALATSAWLVLNLEKKRPVRLKHVLPDLPYEDKRSIPGKLETVQELWITDVNDSYRVNWQDLDLNNHVTSTVYIELALETMPREIVEQFRPVEIIVSYLAQAFYGDTISTQTQIVAEGVMPVFVHRLDVEYMGKELTRLKTMWKMFS